MAQKQKGVADAVIKAKLHTPYQNLGIVSDQRLLRRIVGKFHNQRKVHNSFLGQTAVFRHRPLCRSLAPRLWFNRPSPWIRSFLTAR